ncbi:tyrosine-protein phosphatase 1 [Dichotomopilus funicola]|uniref:Tyrosine-protein phosphatase 1 n=1 Tax=Dichotomopilus funicola TaxID=1934379 RepID=A0AAN6ZMG1_9PEZI|nr:tyrosine-protein phosphatase 1 [Dichotomopilus funicola]
MEHLGRFHRRKKDSSTTPTIITSNIPDNTTPAVPPSTQTDVPSAPPMRTLQKLSPFRVFQRSSGKRARDSPPASLPHSPAAAPVAGNGAADGRPVSPLSLQAETAGNDEARSLAPPKMPKFLDVRLAGDPALFVFSCPRVANYNLVELEMDRKFTELVWRERMRLRQSAANSSPDFRWAPVTGPHLKVLDRYLNIQPWNNNRIKLRVPEGHVDYVNASPIVLEPSPSPDALAVPQEPDRYIAMQGPKQASAGHVWRMVVEQLESPGVIVMLTETHEGAMEKCFPYFPRSESDPPVEINEHDEFGDGFRATLRCEGLEETPAGDAIELRKLVIRIHSHAKPPAPTASTPAPDDADIEMLSPGEEEANSTANFPAADQEQNPPEEEDVPLQQPGDTDPSPDHDEQQTENRNSTDETQQNEEVEERVIYHFLYKKWPDFGVPSRADIDSFFTLMRLSRERNASPSNPRIVHCSAGVGRSGTFIALEHLMRELEAGVLERWDDRVGAATDDSLLVGGAAGEQDGTGSSGDSDSNIGKGDLIFETVNALREQRRTMVQAESQYIFIYRVLRQMWLEKYGEEVREEKVAEQQQPEMSRGAEARRRKDGEPAPKRLEVDPFVERD